LVIVIVGHCTSVNIIIGVYIGIGIITGRLAHIVIIECLSTRIDIHVGIGIIVGVC